MPTDQDLKIVHHIEAQRFEAVIQGQRAIALYHLDGDVMRMTHTEVAPALRGGGVAAALVAAAFTYAQAHELKVAGQCTYVQRWMQRHPETRALWA